MVKVDKLKKESTKISQNSSTNSQYLARMTKYNNYIATFNTIKFLSDFKNSHENDRDQPLLMSADPSANYEQLKELAKNLHNPKRYFTQIAIQTAKETILNIESNFEQNEDDDIITSSDSD